MTPEPGTAKRSGPRVIAIANQKGGVGKTTTAINLGTALAATKKRVVILDLDPQGNASTGLGVPRADRQLNVYHLLIAQATIAEAIRETDIPGLSIVPSGVDLSGAEIELVGMKDREFYLKNAIRRGAEEFDYVLIDCPPALGLLTLNALAAADALLVPLAVRVFRPGRHQSPAADRRAGPADAESDP